MWGKIKLQKLMNKFFYEIVLNNKIPIRLACIKPDGMPTVVSLWYIQKDDRIFCATQKNAKIVSYLQNNPKCGFEIAADKPPYKGIRAEGTAHIIQEKGPEILEILIDKYLGKKESILSKFLKENSKNEVAIEIIPQKIFNYDYTKRMRDI